MLAWWTHKTSPLSSSQVEKGKKKICKRCLHPRNLTWIPNIAMFKGSYLFQTIILGIHVSFRECKTVYSFLLVYTSFFNVTQLDHPTGGHKLSPLKILSRIKHPWKGHEWKNLEVSFLNILDQLHCWVQILYKIGSIISIYKFQFSTYN